MTDQANTNPNPGPEVQLALEDVWAILTERSKSDPTLAGHIETSMLIATNQVLAKQLADERAVKGLRYTTFDDVPDEESA